MESIASSLLSLAHALFQPGFCPGDWVWATSMAGALIGLVPVAGMVLVAIVRKFTGNRYHGPALFTIGGLGLVFVLLLPLLLTTGVSSVYRAVFAGGTGGLSGAERATLGQEFCFVGVQAEYLGGGQNIYETLFYPGGSVLAYGYYLGALVGLPILALLAVMLLGRVALRRGPKWPGRLLWVPFVAFVLFSVGVEANTAVHLWLGFLPATVLGVIPVALVGPPSWSTIQKSDRPPEPRRPEPPRQPPPYVPPAEQQPPPPPPPKQYPPTSVAPSQDAAALAAAPGPVPVPPGSGEAGSGRFRRLRRLGHGGFGTVWEAQDTQLGRTVALKIAHAPDRDTEARMEREARALAALTHPNCVRVYDLVEEPDGLALVMEYLHGQALAEAVDTGGPLDDVSAGRLWATMASALSAAHDKGVLHRDVKPSNIIVDPEGLPHLIDFGIARSRGDSKLTATGMMIGTPDYVAPETAGGAPASPASDAWQLAATVSYALSGYPPRGTRETPMAALMAAARAEPPSRLPRQSVHARLLMASLDPQPRNRPTLRAVCREVEGWLARAGQSADGPVTKVVPRAR
ncbi:serine/threonine-protein kinase [Prauserella muralis]|uniref:non-specific serine/threonine protein kinase n=1 Tax=Prauserella muralis TaxID=588067 RepID=A0A2V4AMT4_9PSEU|nr:serine/threonine-protein kinase [Prauserella muralis]PXY21294.1 serine/threonine protein kinase [Prauserella muralis]TWE30413.1 serine/threonine protein kinase [Prauserella muralis]